MTKDDLIKSAGEISPPPKSAAEEYRAKRERLAVLMDEKLFARPDLEKLIGAGNEAMMQDNHRNHTRFMESLFFQYVPQVFVETIIWVYRAYRQHGFNLAYWPAKLDIWVEILKKELTPESFSSLYPFYHWMIINQAAFVDLSQRNNPTIWDKPSKI